MDNLDKLLKRLDDADKAYYVDGNSIMSDAAYDLLRDKVLKQLPPDHPRFKKVGHTAVSSWPKEKHTIFMGSQNKVATEKAIKEWVSSVMKDLGTTDCPEFVLQHKIDGFSLEAKYLDKSLSKAVTRGNGIIGENIQQNARHFRFLPGVLPLEKEIVVRGEGVLTKENFNSIQEQTGYRYKNGRNAASGISRRYDGTYSEFIHFIAYDINAQVSLESEKIEVLNKLGFKTVATYIANSIDEILEIYREYRETKRALLPYEIDGLVLKLNSIELQEKRGVNRNRPEGQIALKFDTDQAITTVKSIQVQIGRTGKLTPVAILEPVELMGSTVQKATLHNFAYIDSNFIGVGAEVVIEKKGDIIPQVVDIASPGEDYKGITECPSCGGPLYNDSVNLWCKNPGCKEREVNRIAYWAKTIDIKGFSKKFIEKLWDEERITSTSDLYKLQPDDFLGLDGFGEKKIKGFLAALQSTSEMYLDTFITALGIPTCSSSTAEILMNKFEDWDRVKKITVDDLIKLPGFALTSATTICDGIKDVSDMADELLKVIKIKKRKSGALTGKSVCITGTLTSMSRNRAKELVIENGGSFKGSVNSDLSYLVTNDPDSGTGKNAKAEKYNNAAKVKGEEPPIKVINEEEFLRIIGFEPKPEQQKEEKAEKEDKVILEDINLFED